jgi:hypothetical protein
MSLVFVIPYGIRNYGNSGKSRTLQNFREWKKGGKFTPKMLQALCLNIHEHRLSYLPGSMFAVQGFRFPFQGLEK